MSLKRMFKSSLWISTISSNIQECCISRKRKDFEFSCFSSCQYYFIVIYDPKLFVYQLFTVFTANCFVFLCYTFCSATQVTFGPRYLLQPNEELFYVRSAWGQAKWLNKYNIDINVGQTKSYLNTNCSVKSLPILLHNSLQPPNKLVLNKLIGIILQIKEHNY